MAGKKKGKKGTSQDTAGQPSGSQQQGGSASQQSSQVPQSQQQQGPERQQQQQGPQAQQQQQQGPQGQQQRASQGQQPQQQGQQLGFPGQQPPRGPPGRQQQQQGYPGQQPPRGPPGLQQPWGPPGQQRQQGYPGQQPPRGPPGQQQPWGPQGQQQQAPQGQQQQWNPQHQPQQDPQGPQPQRGQQAQRGRGRGRGRGRPQQGTPHPQYVDQPQVSPQPLQQQQVETADSSSSRASSVEGFVSQGPQSQQPQRGRGRGRGGQPHQGMQRRSPAQHPQQVEQPQMSPQSTSSRASSVEGAAAQTRSSMSRTQISRTEAGQGDSQYAPLESSERIKPGTRGRKITVETNHLQLNLGKLKMAVHYDVNLVPDTPKKLLREVLEAFRRKHYSNRFPAFDGRKNLYSTSMLPFGDFIADEIAVQDGQDREKKFKVEIKFANNVDLTPLHDLIKSNQTPREAMQVVDIVLRSAPALSCISVGRSFFLKPRAIIDLGEGMEMYNGFYQSAIRGWKPFLNVDVAHKSFPKNMNLLDILPELFDSYYQPFRREDLGRPLSRQQQETLQKYIRTLRVSYEIPNHPSTRRVYRVNGLGDPATTSTFQLDNGQQTTIEKYFERNKNYRLRYPHLPTLWVGAVQRENRILLPLELCTVEEGQAIPRKMTENQTSKMIKYAATNTSVRKDKIMTAMQQANHNAHPTVREFGFSIGNQFERLEARVLKPPTLGYVGNKPAYPSRGVWRGDKFFVGVTINKWTIACVDRRPARPDDLAKFAEMIQKNASISGMTITSQAERPFDHISGQQSIHDIRKYFQNKKDKKYDVIFVIVPNSGPQYSYVKTAAEINVGCLTQCIKTRTLNKMNPQTAINILLKVNSKLNGTNHCLLTRPPIMDKPCMLMGADVTHPSPDSRDIPSVAAVTASHDPKAFQYNICWRLQPPTVEIIEDLEAMVIEQLKFFYKKTGIKPVRIVFFRDGVSEGQFAQVQHAEITAIRAACKKLQPDGYEPSITFLVVQKRHHTRLFPTDPRDSEDRNMNVPAGTCVDTTITHPFMQDFYLVSHASIQGVAKPTKYCTLWDDNHMDNDSIEELTYYLCHMFTRCNRSVSYPAPTYYAHLAAARAKVYIENERLNMNDLRREFDKFQIQDVIRKDLPMFFV